MNARSPVGRHWKVTVQIWVLTALLSVPAAAQNALGDGRALDANLQQGSGGFNSQAQGRNFSSANDVMTGNVPGLGYFHDDLGYGAVGAFGDSLSDDDLFRFRARSLSSTPMQTPGANFTWGLAPGGVSVYRSHSDASAAQLRRTDQGRSWGSGNAAYEASGLVVRVPGRGAGMGYGSPHHGATAWDSPSDEPGGRIGLVGQGEGRLLEVMASPLFGVRRRTLQDALGNPWHSSDSTTVQPGVHGDEPDDSSLPAQVEASPQQPPLGAATLELGRQLQVMADPRIGPPASLPADQLVAQVERGLMKQKAARPGESVYRDLLDRINPQPDPTPGSGDPTDANLSETDQQPDDAAQSPAATGALDGLLAKLDYDLPRLATLAGKKDTAIGRLMRTAQDEIGMGRYLDAQEHYEQVLRLQPDQPMALVGLLHAQIGGGMTRSAQVTLRRLFEHHPELIAARYEAALLPGSDRLDVVRDELIRWVDTVEQAGPALVLAYVGYQRESGDLVRFALDAALARAPRDPLVAVLRRIWLERQSEQRPAVKTAPSEPLD